MAVNKLDPKVIFASEAPAQDTPAVFTNRTVGWGETRKNGGRPTIKQMNAEQQSTDLKILWLNENAITPFDPTIDYPTNAVTIKDGAFKIFNGSVWNIFLTKASVGLGDVDNTSDLSKPISTATQSALNDKASVVSLVNLRTSIDLKADLDVVKRGIGNIYDPTLTYNENERVILLKGDVVKSTVSNNTNNPNTNMTGWVDAGNIGEVNSIAELLAIQNPKAGDVVFVKGHHPATNFALSKPYKGGGRFVYDASKSSINDGGMRLNGWVRQVDNPRDVYAEWFGAKADGGTDDHAAIMAAINYLCPTSYQGSWDATSNRSSGAVRLGVGEFKISDQILLPPYIKLVGFSSRWYFAGDKKNFTNIIADFSDVNKFAIQSANYVVSTGQLVANNTNISGTSGFDARTITATHGIEVCDLNIVASKQQLGGLRLICSPKSEVSRVFITGFDIGCKIDASWDAKISISTQHYKVGLYLGYDSNACKVDGYFTGDATKAPLASNYWKSLLQSYEASTGLTNKYSLESTIFGFVNYWNQGCESGTIISEGNSISVFNARGNLTIGTLYSEKNTHCSVVGFSGNVEIGDITGVKDSSTFEIGINSVYQLHNDNQTQVTGNRIIAISEYGSAAYVPTNFNYTINGVFLNHQNSFVFVSATTGKNTNTGGVGTPVASIDEALRRLSTVRSLSPTSIAMPNSNQKEIVILDSSAYNLSTRFTVSGYLSLKGTQTVNKASITFNQPIIMNSCDLIISGINLNRGSVDYGGGENGCLWFGDGRNSITSIGCDINLGSYSFGYPYYLRVGIVDLIMRGGTVTGGATTTVVQSAYQNDELHLFNILLKGVTFNGGIETRADKGFAFPSANRGWIKGITLP